MLGRLLARSVFLDLVKVTLLALVAISALFMAGGTMYETVRHGVDPRRVILIMPLMIPPTIPFTLPTCVLFACTVVYGRMSANVEITALKAGGIHVRAVLWPALWLGIGSAAMGVVLADRFIPACNRLTAQIILSDIQANIFAYLRRYGSIVDSEFPYEVYVRGIRGDRLIRPIIKHRNEKGDYDLVAEAIDASLTVEPNSSYDDGPVVAVCLRDGTARARDGSTFYFRERIERMPIPRTSAGDGPRLELMTFDGCRSSAQARRDESAIGQLRLATLAFVSAGAGDLPEIGRLLEKRWLDELRMARCAREAETEVHLRLVQATAAIPFVLLGCPVSILFPRRDFLHAFFACFLPIITVFYPCILLTYNFSKEGIGAPGMSLWAPVALAMIASAPLLRRVIRF